MQSAVSVKDLKIAYGDHTVIEKMSIDIAPREFLVLLGPSGCGKSTLLNAIAGLQEITSGEVWISGKNVSWEEPKDRGIGMVFQSYALYPRMSVRKNLSFGLRVAGLPKSEIEARVARTAALLHLDKLLDRRPAALSGGQRQRVAIGRALVREVDVFLFDEPLSNLDAKLRNELRVEIKKLHQRLGNTMIYVTHDQVEALTLADRIAIMRDGVIQQLASPAEIYRRPANLFVAGFIGAPAMNFIEGRIERSVGAPVFRGNGLTIDLSGYSFRAVAADGPATLGFRPEHLVLDGFTSGLPTIPGRVSVVEPMGPDAVVWFDWADQSLSLRLMGDVTLEPGDALAPGLDIAKASLFGADGSRL
ncbi:ABC transporter ATP-binding protein [Rhizobium anhuiense]|jgi:multiple sugar transport system ATP-binding protein|uniref:ABC transporter ATP-binding protein n=1 Tax=Rhizobium anhuiense TaxID=1184720 RepID=A0A432NXJ2_9HYPH|nr:MULTISPECIES: ATP-binding cassette domain-containing protein [Rhizobium]MBB3300002.1 multiple sugar transport system ATP-binding protein [Rhizobium sp. BK112]MBB3369459.1 multiple sugar transport system ATP-binding protein [Rhizobium sp. BK077]MBB4112574.1 multiple sugar transport system ATP-binding protein [Rhizobium sp. BK226]MBB4179996.1 multiple sugar transport system ATP-binding protein [Rhizobium sp. BK109]MBB4213005.1 multiple sugar transport system ATP-binding protein [Rhizobium sp.